jgi:hypothetical protein
MQKKTNAKKSKKAEQANAKKANAKASAKSRCKNRCKKANVEMQKLKA